MSSMYTHATGTKRPNGDTHDTASTNGTHKKPDISKDNKLNNNWTAPGPAAYDFRSDTITTPTASQLTAIHHTTLLDDVFLEDPTTTSFESLMANLTGHESALFVVSGTMGNQIALRSHLTAPPHAVLCDSRSHIVTYEAGGLAVLTGAMTQCVVPANGHHLTLEDIQKHAVIDDDVHSCPTRVISLENTLNGTILPLSEVRRIANWAHAQDPAIKVHMDGARLWEADAAGAGSLKDYASAVDSVSLCFSKGLGAPIGSVLVGNKKFIKQSRWIRKSIGGGMRMAGVLTAAARAAVEDTFLSGRLKENQARAKRVAEIWTGLGGKLLFETETNMVWLDLGAAGLDVKGWILKAEEYGLRMMGGRLVVHYQVCEDAIERFGACAREVLRGEVTEELKGKPELRPEELRIETE